MKTKRIIFCFISTFAALIAFANSHNYAPVSSSTICRDLVGHKLSEGADGYHSREWHWTIEEGEIQDFQILSVRENTSSRYTIDAQLLLSTPSGSTYNAEATIYYIRTNRGWEIEFIKSLSMNIVRTYRYDDCVYLEKGSGYLNSDDLYVTNNCEITLEVGGKICGMYGGWKKFSRKVRPHETMRIDYSVADYTIDYVERP